MRIKKSLHDLGYRPENTSYSLDNLTSEVIRLGRLIHSGEISDFAIIPAHPLRGRDLYTIYVKPADLHSKLKISKRESDAAWEMAKLVGSTR